MGFTLDKVVPWGRSFDEYVSMFGLTASDLDLRIIGCGDGPASFNSGLTIRGGRAVSVDPIYAFGAADIRRRINETYETVMAQMRENMAAYVWDRISSVEELGRLRTASMEEFLSDYEAGRAAARYVAGELPKLPFKDGEFDMALSSHFLFLYSEQLSLEFHVGSIEEMLRVAREVRIFPLLSLDGNPSPHLPHVIGHFNGLGLRPVARHVGYEFQRGGTEMLVIGPGTE